MLKVFSPQLVAFGDFLQLPPVQIDMNSRRFCFESPAWIAAGMDSLIRRNSSEGVPQNSAHKALIPVIFIVDSCLRTRAQRLPMRGQEGRLFSIQLFASKMIPALLTYLIRLE
jgi:hypothetical protein